MVQPNKMVKYNGKEIGKEDQQWQKGCSYKLHQ